MIIIGSSIEPGSANAVAAAVHWIEAALSGSIATAIAVIGVASVGLLMLAGRIEVRRATQVIAGCFILFGASSIAAGIIGSLERATSADQVANPGPPPAYPMPVTTQSAADPYAGAAVPPRR